jgi:sodium/proline symporter
MNYTLIGFIFYLIAVLILGFVAYKLNRSHSDYFLAGRKLSPWLVAFSERASGESAWLLLGLPGAALAVGLIEAWTALGCVSGIIISWYIIAKDLREQTEKYDSITLPTFIANKLGGDTRLLRIVSTLIIVFFFTFYLAAQFNGAGKVLFVTFGIPHFWGLVIGGTIIILYTMMGGFFAVVWTDFIQGLIMVGALIIIPIVGLIELSEQGLTIGEALNNAGSNVSSWSGGYSGWAAAALIIGGLSWGFGYFGQPHVITRFMAINDPKNIKVSRRVAITWAIPAFTGAMMIGLIGLAMYGQGHFSDVEEIMPTMAGDLLPAWLAGIFISGAIAAMMSTADSQLLVISSSVIEDFYVKTLGKQVTQKRLLFLSRVITLTVGIFGFIIAATSEKLIFTLVSYAWAGLGSSFGPAILLTLKWKKTTRQGVLAGMLTGAITTIIWQNIDALDNMISVRFTSFVFAFLVIIFVSLATNKKVNNTEGEL